MKSLTYWLQPCFWLCSCKLFVFEHRFESIIRNQFRCSLFLCQKLVHELLIYFYSISICRLFHLNAFSLLVHSICNLFLTELFVCERICYWYQLLVCSQVHEVAMHVGFQHRSSNQMRSVQFIELGWCEELEIIVKCRAVWLLHLFSQIFEESAPLRSVTHRWDKVCANLLLFKRSKYQTRISTKFNVVYLRLRFYVCK